MSQKTPLSEDNYLDLAPEIVETKNELEKILQGHTYEASIYALAFLLFIGLDHVFERPPRHSSPWSTITKKLAKVLSRMTRYIVDNQIDRPATDTDAHSEPRREWVN